MGVTALFHYHPFKFFWGFVAVLLGAIRFPFWLIYYIPPGLRPHPQYTLRQAIKTQILKTALWNFCMTRVYTPLKLTHSDKKGDRRINIPRSNKDIYVGICADKEIKPATIPAQWYPSAYDPAADKGKKIILHFHGGAFVIGTESDREAQFGGKTLGKIIGKSLWVGYRLSSNPGGRFPAALQDAVSAYQFLLDKGIPAKDIIVGGDSAGGNLTIAFLRYIATTGVLPEPRAALLWSPWVDVSQGCDESLMPQSPHYHTDYLVPGFGSWGANTYAPKSGPVAVDSVWVSPKAHPFKTGVPIWVQTCGQEVLFEDDKEFYENMKGVEGNKAALYIEPVANHDIILAGALTGFEKAAEKAAREANIWLGTLK